MALQPRWTQLVIPATSLDGAALVAAINATLQHQNDINWDIYYIVNLVRGVLTSDGSTLDHGALAGLADDDHTQYIRVDGTRAFSGAQSMGGFKLTSLAAATAATDAMRYGQRVHTVLDGDYHSDTLAGALVAGDLLYVNVTPKLTRMALSVPAATFRKYVGTANGATIPAYQDLFDVTVPTTVTPGDAAATGTAEVAARRDHVHAVPATMPATAHNILSATHGDTTPAAVVRGDLISGQGVSPAWARLAISVPAATFVNILGAVNGDTEPGYKALFDATVPTTIAESAVAATGSAVAAARRDHTHGAPATWTPAAHTHSHDTDLTGVSADDHHARDHAATHGPAAADALKLDDLAAPDDNADLNASTSAHGLLPKATAPAAGLLTGLAIANGEAAWSGKALFDNTNPAALGTAAPGTQVVAARRDHVHALPAEQINFNIAAAGAQTNVGLSWVQVGGNMYLPQASDLVFTPATGRWIVVVAACSGATFSVRIQDATDANTIAQIDGIAAAGVYSDTTFANWPDTFSNVIQLQVVRTAGSATNAITLSNGCLLVGPA